MTDVHTSRTRTTVMDKGWSQYLICHGIAGRRKGKAIAAVLVTLLSCRMSLGVKPAHWFHLLMCIKRETGRCMGCRRMGRIIGDRFGWLLAWLVAWLLAICCLFGHLFVCFQSTLTEA